MDSHKLLNIVAGLFVLVGVLHGAALFFSLYWHFRWFDLLTHFVGGMSVALLLVWILYYSPYIKLPPPSAPLLLVTALAGAFFLGIAWEGWEFFLGQRWSPEGYLLDTGIDLFMDTSGGLLGYLLLVIVERRSTAQKALQTEALA